MKITEKFRNKIIASMPNLSREDAEKIAALEQCSTVTVYAHWKNLKEMEGDITGIMLSIGELANSKKKETQKEADQTHKRLARIMKQLSAA